MKLANEFLKLETVDALDNMEVLHTRFAGRRFPQHFHDTFVIQLVVAGSDVCDVSGLTAEPDQVFVHTPRASHTGGPTLDRSLEYKAVYPTLGLATKLCHESFNSIPEISFVSNCDRLRRNIVSFFDSGSLKSKTNQLRDILERVRCLTLQACPESRLATTISCADELASAREYLVLHCQRDVSIEELSEVCHLSKYHLIREFKKRFGITPRQYLISQRVLLAKQLLAQGVSIATVALQAGFSDQSHLNRCFKRVSGFNPGQYVNG